MRVSLWIREIAAKGKRRYIKPNRKKNYPEDTAYCLRYAAEGKHQETSGLGETDRAQRDQCVLRVVEGMLPEIGVASDASNRAASGYGRFRPYAQPR